MKERERGGGERECLISVVQEAKDVTGESECVYVCAMCMCVCVVIEVTLVQV